MCTIVKRSEGGRTEWDVEDTCSGKEPPNSGHELTEPLTATQLGPVGRCDV